MRRFAFTLITTAALFAAKKERDWKTGRLTNSQTVNVGAQARTTPNYGGPSVPPPPVATRTLTAEELVISGNEFTFIARSLGSGVLIPHRCRYIVGDEIRYVQEKSLLYLLDTEGKECRAQIVRQERNTPAPPKP